MPEPEDAIGWDFLTVIDGWILYGLPILLVVAAAVALRYGRSHAKTSASSDSLRTVRRIGLIHCALAAQSLIFLAQELLTMRTMGIPESHISLVVGSITTVMNTVLAFGLKYLSPIARRLALFWYALLSLISLLAIAWLYYYRVGIDPMKWPEQVVSKILPLFLLVVMLLPRAKRVFANRARVAPATAEPSDRDGAVALAEASVGWRIISLAALLFLIVVCSNLVVDAADWGYRLAFVSESVP
jgi:hypothetical protein